MKLRVLKVKITNISWNNKNVTISQRLRVCGTMPGTVYVLECRPPVL